MARAFDPTSKAVPPIDTRFRRIVTAIPAPGSVETLRALQRYEPVSMTGQPPIVWDRAEGFQVYDAYGNMWLDWSSGVVVANAGHGAPEIRDAIQGQVERGLLHSYCFPNAARAALVEYLVGIAPAPLAKVFLLTTGSEATECAIKLARTYGHKRGGPKKIAIVSFERAFHGRTLGAQMIGGIPALKGWIGNLDADMHQVPFPDGFRTEDVSFDLFCRTLEQQRVDPAHVAAVILETFQGGGASFAPAEYIQALARWCREQGALLVFDEIQCGVGRCGAFTAAEAYGVTPDVIAMAKGLASGLPIGAILVGSKLAAGVKTGDLGSTFGGGPVVCAAALATLEVIDREGLIANAIAIGERLRRGALALGVSKVQGRGLLLGLHLGRPAVEIQKALFARRILTGTSADPQVLRLMPPLVFSAGEADRLLEALAEVLR